MNKAPTDDGSVGPADGQAQQAEQTLSKSARSPRAGFARRLRQSSHRLHIWGQAAGYWLVAQLVAVLVTLLRLAGPDRASNFGGWIARSFGPRLPVHKVGLSNLRSAFPEKNDKEHRAILREVWDNLGRTAAEYAHLDSLWDYDPQDPDSGRVEVDGIETFMRLRDDGKPAIVFSAHLGNWELPAICAARHGLPVTAVYRAPNNPHVARQVEKIRNRSMGELLQAGSGQAVVFAMASVLEEGGHLGMLVDQFLRRGLKIPFFGRIAHTNPALGRLARRFDCPVHGVRVIRLAGNRFRLELTDALTLPRDEQGMVDVEGAMVEVNRIVEGWVRDRPGQWLWLHRRWR